MARKRRNDPLNDKLWYKNAVIYEVPVRACYDSDGNGIGDFRGLTEKLGYLQDLGVTALWLLPFYPSPLKDDGYDIADYHSVNPIYGTLADFKLFLREAHNRGLRVITELVINHTSDQHPWFQRSRRAKPGSSARDFYVWSDTPERYKDARIIFKDFETSNWAWDPVANAYFWHRFYSHQPDLNYGNPLVHKEVFKALDFWLDMGVDGLRLDAIPYLYEEEGTNCENLPQTHQFLKQLRSHVDQKYGDRMLLAEANQWPEDAVAYFGSGKGDECHVAFHFPLMPRLFMAVRMEDRIPIVDIAEQTPPIPETSQWALFLRNHDELTLEMVTDEERDYMYRMYAHDPRARINLGIRRRLAPLLGNDRKRIELLNALLFSLPGTPVLYYGDEFGMGDNIFLGDRNGVRTPMQWSSDRNAGFSRANPQSLYLPIIVDPEYHYETVNVEAQQSNQHSLLWWMKRLLGLRKKWQALGAGSLTFLQPENRKILAYVRCHREECLLIVVNLSRFVQPVELDLSHYKQAVPVELFGRTRFPVITEQPYFLTLGPHAFYWFSLEPRFTSTEPATRQPAALPNVKVEERWEEVGESTAATAELESALPGYVRNRRWFADKAREIQGLRINEAIIIESGPETFLLTLLKIEFWQGDSSSYLLPIGFATGVAAEQLSSDKPGFVFASVIGRSGELQGVLYDASVSKGFSKILLEAIWRRRTFTGSVGEMVGSGNSSYRFNPAISLEPSIGTAEQSNTAMIFGDQYILKLFRRVESGLNPDLEIGRFLTAKGFPHAPKVAGALEYKSKNGEVFTLGILNTFVPQARDAWEYTLDALGRFFDRVRSLPAEAAVAALSNEPVLKLVDREMEPAVREMVGTYMESARLLGQRTAELHMALASEDQNKDFTPEPFSPHYQRGLYQSMRNLTMQNFQLLRQRLKALSPTELPDAQKVLSFEKEILQRFRAIYEHRISALRIRCHGDYHLGQVLHTGKDFIILDFEGEPARALSERRIKRSPLRDVAGMLRSFHYAVHSALAHLTQQATLTEATMASVEAWARYWHQWISVRYLQAYLDQARRAAFLPKSADELRVMLDAFLLEKAIYELGYEMNNRPAWVKIPMQGILQLMEAKG